MAVKIRLQRHGKKGKPFYWIVAADARSKRDGKFLEKIGSYNPNVNPAIIDLDVDGAVKWLQNGAQPTDTVRSILRFKGVMFRMHLEKGVKKGAFTQEEADKRYNAYVSEKEAKVAKRFEAVRKANDELQRKIAGTDMPIKIAEVVVPKVTEEEE